MKTVLTIAGSDSSGGAGIQADIKTIMANGAYAMSAITALTAQNTMGVSAVMEISPEFLKQQIDAVFEDIFPNAVKVGMVSSGELVCIVAERLKHFGAKNIVVDPVMIATSGARLITEDAIFHLKKDLLPLATLVTPNMAEAEVLADMKVETKAEMIAAGQKIGETYGCAVLVKGGHSRDDANDVLCTERQTVWFPGNRVKNTNTHGTGCTLSSAISVGLAKGFSLEESVDIAKTYLTGALKAGLDLGKGSGPLHHGYRI